MSNLRTQEILDHILADLKSGSTSRELAAIRELESINFGSRAILLQLESLALRRSSSKELRYAALRALNLSTSQFVASENSKIPKHDRQVILSEIEKWKITGLIEERRAEVISRHYDFDIKAGIQIKKIEPQKEEKPEQSTAEPMSIQPVSPATVPVTRNQPKSRQIKQAVPRPTISQILLSETSIRIYLYLGAFFVIASAAILAAVVEAARLPILLIATMIFAGGAVGIKYRLPQPSFALAVVFSFLLPIDAGVFADTINMSARLIDFYWGGIFLIMACVWGFNTWFYESRLFSLTAFMAFALAVLRFDNGFNLSSDWSGTTIGISGLIGLFIVRNLRTWRDKKFIQPLFIAIQVLQLSVLIISLINIGKNLFEPTVPAAAWIAHTLTWLFAAAFFAASNLLVPSVLFPWMAVASLFFIPSLFLNTFDASATVHIIGLGIWGTFMALMSELVLRVQKRSIHQYNIPLLVISLPLFMAAFFWGTFEDIRYAFSVLLSMGGAYTVVNILHPRWYVWSLALLADLGAYFTFFTLPMMQNTDVYFGYQLLIASVVLLTPELFKQVPLTFKRSWDWPPVALGAALMSLNLLLAHVVLIESDPYFGRSALTLAVYTILFVAFAMRFKQPLMGYLATTSAALTVIYTLVYFELDLWLPSLTMVSVTYYFAGYLIKRNGQHKPWGVMLINSGLALGAILSTVALITLKIAAGGYILAISALFLLEMVTSRNGYLELMVVPLCSFALIVILNDFKVRDLSYYLFGLSLLWLLSDAILHLTFRNRLMGFITKGVGAIIGILFVVEATINNGLISSHAAICFAIYTAFFASYAWIYKKPELGYLSTASAATTTFYTLDHFNFEAWLPIFTGLSLGCYLMGYLIRKNASGWPEMFCYSGLGLGSIMSLVALIGHESTGGWYAGVIGVVFVVETVTAKNGWLEAGIQIMFSIAVFLILYDFKVNEYSYILLALSLVWLGGDVTLHKTFEERKMATPTRLMGTGIVAINVLMLLESSSVEAMIGFGVYAIFFAAYGWLYNQPPVGYASTTSLPLAVFFGLRAIGINPWLFPIILVAVVYYVVGYLLRQGKTEKWEDVLLVSGLGLGSLTALAAPFQSGGIEKSIPIAIAATLFAVEAFYLRNVWLAFPANGLYLISYFTLLIELNVDEPQYFSIGAALLGMLMHYLLTRVESKTGAFIMGTISQLVLLGTSYIQLISTSQVGFFFVLFFQSLVIIFYGLYMRSRSLVFAPITIVVFATLTILYSALRNLSLVIIIGTSGIVLLTLGILAVLMREKITSFVERFSDWNS